MRFPELSFFVAAAILHGAIPVVAHVVDKPALSLAMHAPVKAEIEIDVEPHALPDLPKVTETTPEPQAAIDPSRVRDTPPDSPPPQEQAPQAARDPSDDPYAQVTPSPEAQPPAPVGSGQPSKDDYDPLLPDNGPDGVLTGPPGIGGRPVWQMPGVLPQAQGPAPAPTTPTAPKPVDRDIAGKVLREVVGKSDKEKGIDLPAAGTVASAIGGAVRGGDTPSEGRATFVVRLSPTGQVLDVRVASASAGSKDVWDRAAQAAAARLRGKTLTMTSAYAAGATVYVDVQSVVTMPSGSKGGIHRQGTGVGFDLSDIGANPTRTIRTSFRVVPAK